MSFSLYRQFSPPTAADHCVSTRFTTFSRGKSGEIAVARKSLLQVYWILDDKAPQGDGFSQQDVFTQDASLELRAEYQLSGNIESMSTVRQLSSPQVSARGKSCTELGLPEPGLDALLLTFDTGKAVLVAHDTERVGALRTLAMFNFEQEALASGLQARKGGSVTRHGYGERATCIVDPGNTCAVMLLYGSQLAVMPLKTAGFRKSLSEVHPQEVDTASDGRLKDGTDEAQDRNRPSNQEDKVPNTGIHSKFRSAVVMSKDGPSLWESLSTSVGVGEPHLIRLPLKGIPEGNVRDMVFLEGFKGNNCALAVLHTDTARSWAGRASARRYTCKISVFNLNPHNPLEQSNFSLLWKVDQLPHDSFKLVATKPGSDSGIRTSSVLVFSSNAVQLVGPSQSARYAMAVNGNAAFTVDTERFPLRDVNGEKHGGSLKNSYRVSFVWGGLRAIWLDPKTLLVSNIDNGELAQISLIPQHSFTTTSERSQVALKLDLIGKSNPATSLCMVKQISGSLQDAMNEDDTAGETGNSELMGRMAVAERSYIFLSSRFCDSLLIEVMNQSDREWKPPPVKRLRYDEDEVEHLQQQDVDVLLYGTDLRQGTDAIDSPTRYGLVVRDRLAGSGPVTSICRSQSIAPCTEDMSSNTDNELRRIHEEADAEAKALASKGMHSAAAGVRVRAKAEIEEHQRAMAQRVVPVDHELLVSTGRGPNGSIRKIQWGARCDTLAEVNMDGALAVWSLASSVEVQTVRGRTRLAVDLVVVSLESSTRVLRTSGEGVDELASPFHDLDTSKPTLFAGAIGKTQSWIIQVLPSQIRVVPLRCEGEGDPDKYLTVDVPTIVEECGSVYENVTNLPSLTTDVGIAHVSLCESFLLISFDNGQYHLLEFKEPPSSGEKKPTLESVSREIQSKFVRGLLGQQSNGDLLPPPRVATLVSGAASLPFLHDTTAGHGGQEEIGGVVCVFCRTGLTERFAGSMEAIQVPEGKVVFRTEKALALGNQLLHDVSHLSDDSQSTDRSNDSELGTGSANNLGLLANALVLDLAVALVGDQEPNQGENAFKLRTGAGDSGGAKTTQAGASQRIVPPAACLIALLSNGDVLIYRARRKTVISNNRNSNSVECVFERVSYTTMTRGLRAKSSPKRNALPPCTSLSGASKSFRFPILFPFRALTRLGVFVNSIAPVWVMGTRGQVRVVPLDTGSKRPLPLPVQRPRNAIGSVQASAAAIVPGSAPQLARSSSVVSTGIEDPTRSRPSLENDSLNQIALGSHANVVRGPITSVAFLRSMPDAFILYYSAPSGVAATVQSAASRLSGRGSTIASENLHTSRLRLCVFAGSGADLATSRALAGVKRWDNITAQRVELDQSGIGNAVLMQSCSVGDTVHKVLYIDHASRGASHETQDKVHNPVYSALISRRMRPPELPDPSLPEDEREVVIGPDGEKEINRIEEGFALRPEVFKSDSGTGGPPLVEDVRGVVALFTADDMSKPCDEFVLNPFERGMCQRVVSIQTMQSQTEREFLAVGTGFIIPEGEDRGCKGRVLLFEIVHVQTDRIPFPGRPTTNPKLRLISDRVSLISKKEPRGPVTAVSSALGKLLIAMGNMPSSIKLCHVDENEKAVVPHKFYDTPICVTSMEVVKNFILVGDIHQSFRFIHLQKSNRDFNLLLKGREPIEVYSTNALISGTKVSLAIADAQGNLQLYSPERPLQCIADFHLGAHCLQMERILLRTIESGDVEQPGSVVAEPKKLEFGLYFGTLDGAIGALVPIDEIIFRRLYALQVAMMRCEQVTHNANLNARGFRMFKAPGGKPLARHRAGNIADGVLVQTYTSFDYSLQRTLARMIGTTADTVLDSLMELELATRW